MDNNPSNGNNSNISGYVPPPHLSPLYEALLPFYQPQNTYPSYPPDYPPVYSPVLPETIQWSYTPNNVNWNNPPYVLESTSLDPVPNPPENYVMNNFTGDTSVNTDRTSTFIANSEQPSGAEKQDPNIHVFQCEKCPSKFYSKHAFGGHMSAHSKQAKKFYFSQIMMATPGQFMSAASISGMNEGSNSSSTATSKKRGRKKGKNVVSDETKAKKPVN